MTAVDEAAVERLARVIPQFAVDSATSANYLPVAPRSAIRAVLANLTPAGCSTNAPPTD